MVKIGEKLPERLPIALGNDADCTVRLIGYPTRQAQSVCFQLRGLAKKYPLNQAIDGGFKANQ